MTEFNYKKKRKARPRTKNSIEAAKRDWHEKKFFKDKKTGTIYHVSEMEAMSMRYGFNPLSSSIPQIKEGIPLEEITKPTKAMKVLYGEGKKLK